ncbi:MAG: hypothetical protein WCW26_04190, partial [Candidatus Buchananbacteria bacterium]
NEQGGAAFNASGEARIVCGCLGTALTPFRLGDGIYEPQAYFAASRKLCSITAWRVSPGKIYIHEHELFRKDGLVYIVTRFVWGGDVSRLSIQRFINPAHAAVAKAQCSPCLDAHFCKKP